MKLRSSLLRVAHSNPSLRGSLLPLLKEASEVVALVTVKGGKVLKYRRSDVEEMLTPEGGLVQMFRDADNLPKWLLSAGAVDWVPGFPTSSKEVEKLLGKILQASRPVRINVRSDDRSENDIRF